MNPRRILPMHESDVAALTSCVGEFLRDFGYSTESRVLSHSPLVLVASDRNESRPLLLSERSLAAPDEPPRIGLARSRSGDNLRSALAITFAVSLTTGTVREKETRFPFALSPTP